MTGRAIRGGGGAFNVRSVMRPSQLANVPAAMATLAATTHARGHLTSTRSAQVIWPAASSSSGRLSLCCASAKLRHCLAQAWVNRQPAVQADKFRQAANRATARDHQDEPGVTTGSAVLDGQQASQG